MPPSSTNHQNFKVSAADWNKTSQNYAQNISKAPMSIPISRLISLLNTRLPFSSATTILDIGCGPGNGTAAIISSFHETLPAETKILATDFSQGMVDVVTRTRSANLDELQDGSTERQLWERVQPAVMDATNLSPLPDASISHIIANFVFFMTASPETALKEALRVLQPQGICACSSWAKMQWMELLDLAAQRTFPVFNKPVPEMPVIAAQWTSAEGVAALMRDAGFADVQTEYVEAPIIAPDPGGFAGFFLGSGNPAVTWITDVLGEEEIKELEKAFGEVIKECCDRDEGGAYVLSGTAVLASGRK